MLSISVFAQNKFRQPVNMYDTLRLFKGAQPGKFLKCVTDSGSCAWVTLPAGDSTQFWGVNGNAGTTSANFVGTTDGQPLRLQSDSFVYIRTDSATFYMGNSVRSVGSKKISGFEIKAVNGNGIYGSIYFLNLESDGGPFTAMNIDLYDSTNGTRSLFEMNRGQVEIEVTDDAGNTGICKVTAGTFNAGNYLTSGQQYLFTDWSEGYFSIGNTSDFSATLVGEEAQSKLYAYSNNGFSFKNVPNSSDLTEGDSLTISTDGDTFNISSNLPININGVPVFGHIQLDSINLTGATINLQPNTTHIVTASGAITNCTFNFPAAQTNDEIVIQLMYDIALLTFSGTGISTITTPVRANTKLSGVRIFHNYGGNWY